MNRPDDPQSPSNPPEPVAVARRRLRHAAEATLSAYEVQVGQRLDLEAPAKFFNAAVPLVRVVCPMGSHGRAASILRTDDGPLFVGLLSMPPFEVRADGGFHARLIESKTVLVADLLEVEPDSPGHAELVAGCRCGRTTVDREVARAAAQLALRTRPRVLKLTPQGLDARRTR